jgi:hypothetical protein
VPRPITPIELRGLVGRLIRKGQLGLSQFEMRKEVPAFNADLRSKNPAFVDVDPGSVTNAGANALMEDWVNVRIGKKRPFYPQVVEFSFEYWYNYFFDELNDTNTRLRFAAWTVNDDGTFRGEATPPPGMTWRTIFEEMARLGFDAFPAPRHLSAEQALAESRAQGDPLQSKGVRVAFRGDGRNADTVRQHIGTMRQSQVATLRAQRNMDRDWHPFSHPQKVWFRKRNADNCLFTAVSITPQFEIATKFPLLDEVRMTMPQLMGKAQVRVPMTAKPGSAGERWLQAQQGALESRQLTASKTYVYCVRLRDVYDTRGEQHERRAGAFHEYAVSHIPWPDHLLCFDVVRIHYSDVDGNAGHLIVITGHHWLHDSQLILRLLKGGGALATLQAFVKDVVSRGSLHAGRGGIPYLPSGAAPPFQIASVENPFMRGS